MIDPQKFIPSIISLFLIALTPNESAVAQDRNEVAVLEIEGRGITGLDAETLTNYMRSELRETGTVTPVGPEKVEGILAQMGLEDGGCTTAECALEAGRLLGIPHVVLGSVSKTVQTWDLDFQLFNVGTGEVQNAIKLVYEGDIDGLVLTLQRLSWDIMELTPPPGRFPPEVAGITAQVLTFTEEDWRVPRTVVVFGLNDDMDDGDQQYSISPGEVVAADPNYSALELSDVPAINQDDDQAGIVIHPAAQLLTKENGTVDSFAVSLTSEPTSEVRIPVVSSDTTEGTVLPFLLVFNRASWGIPQTVRVTGVDDHEDDGNQDYAIRIGPAESMDSSYEGFDPGQLLATNEDDDEVGVRVHPLEGLVTSESGGSATFSVVLTSQPVADVEFAVSSSDTTEGKVSPVSLTFTADSWNIPQVVTINGVRDDDRKDKKYKIKIRPSVSTDPKYSGLSPGNVSVRNIDYRPGVIVYPVGGLTVSEAGGDTSFTLFLTSKPEADVTISLASSDTTEGVVSPLLLEFAGENWNRPQAVTITGVNDNVDDGDQTFTIGVGRAVSDDPNYGVIDPDDVSVISSDDDEAGMVISPARGLVTTEEGEMAEFTVGLASEPVQDVSISLVSSDPTEGEVSETTLTFSPLNWDSVRTVVVTGADDEVDDKDIGYQINVGASISTADPKYGALSASYVPAMNEDNDTRGIVVEPDGELRTSEAGGADTFSVVLASEPTADVQVAFTTSDSTEGIVSPQSVTFTAADWNIARTVTVTGVDDGVDDGDQDYIIMANPAVSLDPNYDGLDPPDVSVRNTDDDEKGIVVDPVEGLVTTETGRAGTFTVVLSSEPAADVTIPLRSSDLTEGVVSPSSATFGPATWSAPQIITVLGMDDDEDDGDQSYSILVGASSSQDVSYDGIDPEDISVSNTDNDGPGIIVRPASTARLITVEKGSTVQLEVILAMEPQADVLIALSSSDATEGTVSPSSVTFSPDDWNTPQIVTVTGVDDTLSDGDQAYEIILDAAISDDPDYNRLDPGDVKLVNKDDDRPAILVYPTGLPATTESGTASSFEAVLTSEPAASVTLSLKSSDETEATVSPSLVEFRSRSALRKSNWNIPQVITVTGVNDDVDDGDQVVTVVVSEAVSQDTVYKGLDPDDGWVVNVDDDKSGIQLDAGADARTSEAGGKVTFTAVLTSKPEGDAVLFLVSSDTTEGTVSPSTVTFSQSNWSLSQTVTVRGIDDNLDDGDQEYSIAVDSTVSGDAVYNTIHGNSVSLINLDDDKSGISLAISGELETSESGGVETFDVVLTAEPAAEVTVSLASSDATEGTVSPDVISFSEDNWDNPQTVTVMGIDDNVDDGDQIYSVTIVIANSKDANYAAVEPQDIQVTNVDDDKAGVAVIPEGELITAEVGIPATFRIVLTSEPAAPVTFSLTSTATTEGVVSPSSVSFTPDNWRAAQTVTVTGVEDGVEDGDQAFAVTIGPAVSDDAGYHGMDPDDVPVINRDNRPGFIVYPKRGLITTEGGGDTSFAVVLTSRPAADVSLPVGSSDTTEGVISPSTVVFTNENWMTPQEIVITGIDDDLDDGDQSYRVTTGPAASEDTTYSGIDPDDVSVSNIDNELPGIVITPSTGLITTEAGGIDSFTVVLSSEPRENVVLSIKSSDGTEGVASPSSMLFTKRTVFKASNWNVPQTVIARGVNDDLDDSDQVYSITIGTAESKDPDYRVLGPFVVSLTNTDDGDQAGIVVDPQEGLTTTEAGTDTFFTIVMTSEPAGVVTIPVTSSDTTEGKVLLPHVKFSASDWNISKRVRISGLNDNVDDGNQRYTIVLGSVVTDDPGYSGMDPPDVNVTNIDDDQAGIVMESDTVLATTETGGTDTVRLYLASEPTSEVSFVLRSSDETEGSLSPPYRPDEFEMYPAPAERKPFAANLRLWMSNNRKILLIAAAAGGGTAAWVLLHEEPPKVGEPPGFPPLPK